jgi:branched-chain amino acid transport system permease protein
MTTSEFVLQQIIGGLAIGMAYALIAIGYCMVYGILRFINFGHGAVYAAGTYIGYFCWTTLLKWLPLWPSFILAMVAAMGGAAVFGVLMEKVAYKPVRGKYRLTTFMSSLGVAMFVVYGMEFLFGPQPRAMPLIFEGVVIHLGENVLITGMQVFMTTVAIVLLLAEYLFVHHTRVGRAIRACSEDPGAARLMGVSYDHMISLTFAIGSALGAASGMLMGIYYGAIYPYMGWLAGIKGFITAVTGGIGSVLGSMSGGLLLGMAESLGAGFLSSGYRDAIAFGVLMIVMIIRPTGIFAREMRSSL